MNNKPVNTLRVICLFNPPKTICFRGNGINQFGNIAELVFYCKKGAKTVSQGSQCEPLRRVRVA